MQRVSDERLRKIEERRKVLGEGTVHAGPVCDSDCDCVVFYPGGDREEWQAWAGIYEDNFGAFAVEAYKDIPDLAADLREARDELDIAKRAMWHYAMGDDSPFCEVIWDWDLFPKRDDRIMAAYAVSDYERRVGKGVEKA